MARRRTPAGLAGSAVVLVTACLLHPSCAGDRTQPLEQGSTISRDISGDQTHGYTVTLAAGHYLHLTVGQKEADVTVTVLDPRQQELLLVDGPIGKRGVEHVMLVAPEAGSHRVVVATDNARPGAYEIRIETLRPATEADRRRAAGTRLLNQGLQLRLAGGESLDAALRTYRQALDSWRAANEPAWEADTLDRIGRIFETMGRMDEALSEFRRAAEIYRGLHRQDEEAAVLTRIGRVQRVAGEFQEALETYQVALKGYQATGNQRRQSTVLNNMALVYKSVGETQKALDLYYRALALSRAVDDRSQTATTLNNVGELYIALGQFEFALDSLYQALELRGEDSAVGRAISLGSLGTAHRELGQLDLALREFQQALELRRSASRRGIAIALNDVGTTHYELGQFAEALSSFEEALAYFLEVGDRQGAAYVRLNIGWVHLDRGDAGEAATFFAQALPVFRQIADPRGEASALFSIARAEAAAGNLGAARSHVEQSLERIEALRRGSYNQASRSSYLATKHHYYELLIDVLMRFHETEPEAGYAALAFATTERSRARSLLETLKESLADVRQGAETSLIDRERTLQARLNLLERDRMLLERGQSDPDRIAVAKEELRRLLREYQELQAQIRVSSPKYAALTQPQPLDAREIQQVLDEDTLLLEYSLGDQRSYLWLVSPESIQSFVLPGRDEIEARARHLHGLLRRSAQPDVTVQAQLVTEALSQVLLGPVSDQLGSRRLVVVATGALQYLPFAALRLPDPGNPSETVPLVVDHEIVSLPSASLLAVLRQQTRERAPALKTVAVVGDPVFQRDDPRVKSGLDAGSAADRDAGTPPELSGLLSLNALDFAQEEIRAILELVPEDQRLEAAGFDASRELVMSGVLSDYRIVHLVTHGLVDTRHPELSGIVLSLVDPEGRPRNGFLRAHEIYNLDLPAELVVLSACETALGQEVRGEGLIGLTQGLMYAGAARVIVSLWNVSDPSTAELMSRFYRRLLTEDLSPAAALRAAQVSMLREDRWQAPYHWAPFVLQGEWR